MQVNSHIFLTGFMGSGKTSVGKKLARLLRLTFIDMDEYIEKREKLTVQSLFENFGEATFRKIERSCLEEILKKDEKLVVALGGGTVCYENNLEKIKKSGLLIYIELPVASLAQRLENSKVKRPLLKNLKGEALATFIDNKLNERKDYYNKAHIAVSGLSLTPQILREKIGDYKQ
ncbi:MAG: AAA family ATPase [Bacteroidia bacterium]|nr:AAA family ATPase [Bacteroidia bacterium]